MIKGLVCKLYEERLRELRMFYQREGDKGDKYLKDCHNEVE